MNKPSTIPILYAGNAHGIEGPDPLASVAFAAASAAIDNLRATERETMGIVVGTTLGCLETDRLFDRSRRDAGGRYASPAAFSRTLPSTVPAELALRFGIKGPSLILSAGDASAALAIRRAAAWMHHLNLQFCLAGGMDWTGAGVADEESCRAAFLLLERQGHPVMGSARIESCPPIDLAATCDLSLIKLSDWIDHPRDLDIGASVHLFTSTH